MGAMYVLAIVIYVGARIIRNRQGIDLGLINKEIPVEVSLKRTAIGNPAPPPAVQAAGPVSTGVPDDWREAAA